MKNATRKYERVNCCECQMPCAWALPNESYKQNIICDLCRLDEWSTLRWLGIVVAIVPTTIGDEEKQYARWQLSYNLDTYIRESKLPAETIQQQEVDTLVGSLNF